MKTIVNKSTRPLRVPLPGGKVLHLGPGKTGQIADGASEHPALRKLIDAGTIQIRGDGGADTGGGEGPGGIEAGHESTSGRGKAKVPRRGGQRGG
jgi:hypothetical protein